MRRPAAIALLLGSFAVPGALLWACGGALPGPRVCSEREPCGKGRTCVLGRCRKNKTMPVSNDAPLLRFEPVDMAWVHGRDVQHAGTRGADGGAYAAATMGDTIVLGKRGEEQARLLLRFAVSVPPAEKIQRALLTLHPLRRCDRQPGRLAVELAHVLEPWRAPSLTAGTPPAMALPMRATETTITPVRPLRLDVTELVRAWSKHRKRYHGLAVMAASTSATGACYHSGLGGGRGPELRVFLWPKCPDGTRPDPTCDDAGADAATDASSDADGGR